MAKDKKVDVEVEDEMEQTLAVPIHTSEEADEGPEGYPPPKEKKFKVGKPKKITITFRHNRTFELHIGQEVMRFEGRETKWVERDLLNHPSFIQAKKYFIIKGI